MSKARKLPLDDPRWWLQGETLQYCRSRPLFRVADLVAAVRQERVACKLEYLDTRTQPAQRKALLLTAEFFEREAEISEFYNRPVLLPRKKGARPLPHNTLSYWEPDLKKFWPPAPTASERPGDKEPRRRGSRVQTLIRKFAEEEWPGGYDHIETSIIIATTSKSKQFRERLKGMPFPKRDQFLRALDRRQG